jgi:hypothetical protein
MVWDPCSGKNLFWNQGSKRHRIQDTDPQHCFEQIRDIIGEKRGIVE